MSISRYFELSHLLTAEETANERALLPVAEWVTLLKEYNKLREVLNMDERQAEYNQLVHWAVGVLSPIKNEPSQNTAELIAADVDQFIKNRGAEADRLHARLDDPLLTSDKRQETLERLTQIVDELKRADQAKRKLARRAAAAY